MQFTEDLGNNILLELVHIPEGSSLMGAPNSEPGRYLYEGPQYKVHLPAFAMGKYSITQAQWQAVMGDNPSHFKGNKRPVENVSWNDAVKFCQVLSNQTGKLYRLPSESEWEYACRAGTTTPYSFGKSLTKSQANYASESTTDVGSFPANDFGLYDMHGNVWEWCGDHWHKDCQDAPAWPTDRHPVLQATRGGSWCSCPRYCRSAYRYYLNPNNLRKDHIGFRVVFAFT